MKRIILLSALSVAAFTSHAQLYLTGTSYLQNFDGIILGYPTGWSGDTGSTASVKGGIYSFSTSTGYGAWFDSTNCLSTVFAKGFKNCASAGNPGITATTTCTVQKTKTNRALGVRQVGTNTTGTTGFDPGASFILHLANTYGCTNMNLTYNMQSLDTSAPRITTWTVDYGFGATPTAFTPATSSPAIITTGGYTFSNQPVSVAFGSALDNKLTDVWIRVVALSATTLAGTATSGNRTTSAIDDFNLTWIGTAKTAINEISAAPSLALTVFGDATPNNISFGYDAETEGNYNFVITDISGRIVYTQTVNAVHGAEELKVTGLNLTPGMYFAKMSNGNSSTTAKIAVQN